jgi:hypothetical protein
LRHSKSIDTYSSLSIRELSSYASSKGSFLNIKLLVLMYLVHVLRTETLKNLQFNKSLTLMTDFGDLDYLVERCHPLIDEGIKLISQ